MTSNPPAFLGKRILLMETCSSGPLPQTKVTKNQPSRRLPVHTKPTLQEGHSQRTRQCSKQELLS